MNATATDSSFPKTGPVKQKQVLQFLGISHSTLWAWRKERGFPAPIKLTPRTCRWNAEDVWAWLASRNETGNPQGETT